MLHGVVCHIGAAEAGHYVSYIQVKPGDWYCFNDSFVTRCSYEEVKEHSFGSLIEESSGYMLFYSHVNKGETEEISINQPSSLSSLSHYSFWEFMKEVIVACNHHYKLSLSVQNGENEEDGELCDSDGCAEEESLASEQIYQDDQLNEQLSQDESLNEKWEEYQNDKPMNNQLYQNDQCDEPMNDPLSQNSQFKKPLDEQEYQNDQFSKASSQSLNNTHPLQSNTDTVIYPQPSHPTVHFAYSFCILIYIHYNE